jgi:hypothetical protein
MIKKLLFGAGAAYLASKFMGGRDKDRAYDDRGNRSWFGGSRSNRRTMGL